MGVSSTGYNLYLIYWAILLFFVIKNLITYFTTEYGITSTRVISKEGLIRRDIEEINLSSIESINVNQTIIGRILNYGTIVISGRGTSKVILKDIDKVIEQVHAANIEVMANYIFGLPGDTQESMQKTLELSKELCTFGWNAYAAMALPGSKLYKEAVTKGIPLPDSYEGFSFHGYETLPLPTETLTAAEVLEFRDKAFKEYHLYPPFLEKVKSKFSQVAVDNINEMLTVKLKRRIIDEKSSN
jgi:hypothetical protein